MYKYRIIQRKTLFYAECKEGWFWRSVKDLRHGEFYSYVGSEQEARELIEKDKRYTQMIAEREERESHLPTKRVIYVKDD